MSVIKEDIKKIPVDKKVHKPRSERFTWYPGELKIFRPAEAQTSKNEVKE